MNNMKNDKKLLITASTFPRWEHDTEPRFILDYAKAMSAYYNVTVLAPATAGANCFEELEGVSIIRYHYFPIHRWETLCYPGAIVPRIKEKKIRILLVPFLLLALRRQIKKLAPQFDVIHAHWLIPQGICQIGLTKTPYMITGHGGDVTSLNIGLLKYAKTRCMREAFAVTAVSEHLAGKMKSLCPKVNPEVISMGVNVDHFEPQYRKEQLFEQNDKKVILYVGRLAEKKGVTYLIEAMKTIDAKLVIVGDGTLKTSLQEQAKPQGKKIIFLGSKTHEELKEIYASADVFVAPSVTAKDGDQEGFGLVMLEAMASGLPVIASRSGGIVQLIEDQINGILCEEKNVEQLSDAINLVLKDNQLYERLSQASLATVAKYDYRVIAKKYSDLIETKVFHNNGKE